MAPTLRQSAAQTEYVIALITVYRVGSGGHIIENVGSLPGNCPK